jgi:hypothetical protein
VKSAAKALVLPGLRSNLDVHNFTLLLLLCDVVYTCLCQYKHIDKDKIVLVFLYQQQDALNNLHLLQ